MGDKRRCRDASDTGGGEAEAQGLRGDGGRAGGEKLEKKSKKEANHKVGLEGKGKRKLSISESVPCPIQAARNAITKEKHEKKLKL